jgi:hypothetical protein
MNLASSTPGAAFAAFITTLVITVAPTPAMAQAAPRIQAVATEVQAMDLARLEQLFWICDYLGTTRGAEGAYATHCIEISDALRQRKFGDDLDRLVAWWRHNKPAEHDRLAAAERGAIPVASR